MPELTGRKALSHQRIVATAARAVRERGFDRVNVAEVMKEAGLTHGGFYAHFASRDALLAEALAQAGADSTARVRGQMQRGRERKASALHSLLETYLSATHVEGGAEGCPVAALSAEMPRQVPEVAAAARRLVGNLQRLVAGALPENAPREAAWAITSALVGAVQLARALGPGSAARAVLADTKASLLARFDA